MTDPLGNNTTYTYDGVGRRISLVDPNGNAAGGVSAEHTWEAEYDNEDRVRFVRAPAPAVGAARLVSEARYDAVGNQIVAIDPTGQVTKYVYDLRSQLAEVHQSPNPWTDPTVAPSPEYVIGYQCDN